MKEKLLKHSYWGNFDSGVLNIFMAIYLWNTSKNPLNIGLAFAIPLLVDIAGDYYFSKMSDMKGRKNFIVIGNLLSGICLLFLGFSSSTTYIFFILFLKAAFAKLYKSSLEPYEREVMKGDLLDYLAKKKIKVNTSASLGGFLLMILYIQGVSIGLIFLLSALAEIYSTRYLSDLKEIKVEEEKSKEGNNLVIKFTSTYQALVSIALALYTSRLLIFFIEEKSYHPSEFALIMFLVYGLSSILSGRMYSYFSNIKMKTLLLSSLVAELILLLLLTILTDTTSLIVIWFLISLVSAVTSIYFTEFYKGSLYKDLGRSMSKVRIATTIGTLIGQGLITLAWNNYSLTYSFYLSAILLIAPIIYIIINKEIFQKEKTYNIQKI